jgi:hypothetical protein
MTAAVSGSVELPAGVMTWPQLRRHGIEFYRRQGIDFADLNKRLRSGGHH